MKSLWSNTDSADYLALFPILKIKEVAKDALMHQILHYGYVSKPIIK